MPSDFSIRAERLSKTYEVYDCPLDRLRQLLQPGLRRLTGLRTRNHHRDFSALRNVSFEIKRGETVGIIGRNGSGKSTLLQLICGILTPTSGVVETRGRVAALLELGSGFDPQFTGRENIFMNGNILGLSRKEIVERFDEIAAFADIGDFIEQPVRTYSSGMMVRLAFAVAINVKPEILVVDEALAVGDELFQRKCYSRIDAMRRSAATILFVSHSGSTIVDLCDRAMIMDGGEMLAVGRPREIVGYYQKLLYAPTERQPVIREQIRQLGDQSPVADSPKVEMGSELLHPASAPPTLEESFDPALKPANTIEYESEGVCIEDPRILTLDGREVNTLIGGRLYRYTYQVRFETSARRVLFAMMIRTITGTGLGGGLSAHSPRDGLDRVDAKSIYTVQFSFHCQLNSGVYCLNSGVIGEVNGIECYLHRLVDVAMFRVIRGGDSYSTGIVDFEIHPEVMPASGKMMASNDS